MDEPMHVGFAVLNGHVNDADKRARALMREIYPIFLEEVEQLEREGNGIMAVFDQKMTVGTSMYCTLVFAYVNEDRVALPTPGALPGGKALEYEPQTVVKAKKDVRV